MKTQHKTELVTELLPIIKKLALSQYKGKFVAVKEITKEQLMKYTHAELLELQKELQEVQQVKEVQQKTKGYNEINSEEKPKTYKIVC